MTGIHSVTIRDFYFVILGIPQPALQSSPVVAKFVSGNEAG